MFFPTLESNLIQQTVSKRRKKKATNRGLHRNATNQLTLVESLIQVPQINKYLKTIIVIDLSEVIVRTILSLCRPFMMEILTILTTVTNSQIFPNKLGQEDLPIIKIRHRDLVARGLTSMIRDPTLVNSNKLIIIHKTVAEAAHPNKYQASPW